MCTQTSPRDLDILLTLDTYQGMTDDEIESIIEYKARQQFYSLQSLNNMAIELERTNEIIAIQRERVQMSRDMLESIRSKTRRVTPIREPQIATPNVTEVRNG